MKCLVAVVVCRYPFAKEPSDTLEDKGLGIVCHYVRDSWRFPEIPAGDHDRSLFISQANILVRGKGLYGEIALVTQPHADPDLLVIVVDCSGKPPEGVTVRGRKEFRHEVIVEHTRLALEVSDDVPYNGTRVQRDAAPAELKPTETPRERIEPATEVKQPEIMQYFSYAHLPPERQAVSRLFGEVAKSILQLPDCGQRDYALARLLEAKDGAVRASMFKG